MKRQALLKHLRKHGCFLDRLKGPAQLRVLHDFMAEALFLDIETTGLGPYARVTSVATWRNGVPRCFVDGFNLDDLPLELATATLLVTITASGSTCRFCGTISDLFWRCRIST